MTQIFTDNGRAVPVTKVQAGPCVALQVKSEATDGYNAVQFGYGVKKAKNVAQAQIGHYNKAVKQPEAAVKVYPRYVKEMRLPDGDKGADIKAGDVTDLSAFAAGDIVNVTGISKGRGFQGVVKRHKFSGGRKTHGNKDQLRMPGSIGAKGPAHVFKGTRMGGRMGGAQVTLRRLAIVQVDAAAGWLYIKGAVPGARNGLVMINSL